MFTDDAPVNLLKKKSRQHKAATGWHQVGKQKCYFRSEWERKFAYYLEWLRSGKNIRSWKYEPKTFWFLKIKHGVRSYKPDFRYVKNDGSIRWIEIKGWMDPRSKTKLKRMEKYYPKIEIQVLGKDWFVTIGNCLGNTIPGWNNKG